MKRNMPVLLLDLILNLFSGRYMLTYGSLNGSVISWTSELRYLSVYIVSSRVFKCFFLDFVSNRFFMKLFKTSDMNTHTIFLLNPTRTSTQRNLLKRLGGPLLQRANITVLAGAICQVNYRYSTVDYWCSLFSEYISHKFSLLNPTMTSTQRNLLRRLGRRLLLRANITVLTGTSWRHWKRGSGLTSHPPLTSAGFLIGGLLAAGYCRGGLLTGGLMSAYPIFTSFSLWEQKFHGIFAPGSEGSWERKFHNTFLLSCIAEVYYAVCVINRPVH